MEHNVYSGACTGTQMENVVCVQQSTYKKKEHHPKKILKKQHNVKTKNCTTQTPESHLSPSEPDLLQTVQLWETGMKKKIITALQAHMVAAAYDFGAI